MKKEKRMKEIKIKADLWRLTPDWAVAGTCGSFGMARMVFDLSPDWEGLAKRITFFPADGSDAVALLLKDNCVSLPNEVMSHDGTAVYVIDGIGASGETLISCRGELRIIDTAEPGGKDPIERTPSEFEQLRAEVEALRAELRELRRERM